MDNISNSRELFIIEIIINYLQTVYPDIYSDKEIIRKYIQYNKLHDKKKKSETDNIIKFTSKDKSKLEELNIYFYGTEDGKNSSCSDLPGTYLMTIRTIKQLINSTNNSIKDIVSIIYSLFDNKDITDNQEVLNIYLDEIIIPLLLSSQNDVDSTNNRSIKPTFHKFMESINTEEQTLENPKSQKREDKEIKTETKTEIKDEIKHEIKSKITKNRNALKKNTNDIIYKFIHSFLLNNKDLYDILKAIEKNHDKCIDKIIDNPDNEKYKKLLNIYCELLQINQKINNEGDNEDDNIKISNDKKLFNYKFKQLEKEKELLQKNTELDDSKKIEENYKQMTNFFDTEKKYFFKKIENYNDIKKLVSYLKKK